MNYTTTGEHGLQVGDWITFTFYRPWWRRLLDWILRKKPPPAYRITDVTATTFTIDTEGSK